MEKRKVYTQVSLDITNIKEALELAGKWDDKDFSEKRVSHMNTWTENARKRYKSVR